ncbi:MAG: hypothetical protein O2856_05135 [Planctomycetota bacterium]|nr:hypothetical protein [Planctomycetota bacterium]
MRSIPQALMWEMFSRGRWLILGMFLLGIVLPLFIFGALSPFEINPNDIAWLVNLATVGLSGRGRSLLFVGIGGMMLYIIATILVRAFWSDEILDRVHRICVFTGSIAVLIATPCLFYTALRRNLLSRKSNGIAAAVWLVIVILAIAMRPMDLPPLSYPMILAFAALVILPVATVPLSISWNRHR